MEIIPESTDHTNPCTIILDSGSTMDMDIPEKVDDESVVVEVEPMAVDDDDEGSVKVSVEEEEEQKELKEIVIEKTPCILVLDSLGTTVYNNRCVQNFTFFYS